MNTATDPLRLLAAAAVVLGYLLLCARIGYVHLGRRRNGRQAQAAAFAGRDWIVAFASQSGTAEELALQTAAHLQLAGIAAQVCELSELERAQLLRATRILFIASTCGEGDAPDNAARFCGALMNAEPDADLALGHLHYAVLALGDRGYRHFCGFGRALDRWLQDCGAQALFERIEVDSADAVAIRQWQQQLSHLAGTSDIPDWNVPAFDDWTLVERRLLNPGSTGAAVYHLELEPAGAALPAWQSGDLAQVLAPGDPARPREYSIASVTGDARVHLLVRLHRHDDGTAGVSSGWLALQAMPGDRVKMRVRAHRRFRLEGNMDRPLILIGNGTGIAGLRGHLRARAIRRAAPAWLIFGERNAACDFFYQQEIEAWQAAGILERTDTAFSRDRQEQRYVQHLLRDLGDLVREWIERGAAIYVCGSLKGMAEGVDETLARIVGRDALDGLSAAGRYRRDVY